jgi:CheY-like chemotaxis protein
MLHGSSGDLFHEVAPRGAEERLPLLVERMAHDLRAPLTAILGWAELARERKDDPSTVAQAFDIIERNARAQAQLMDELVDVARLMENRLKLSQGAVQLAALIEETLSRLDPIAAEKGLTLLRALRDDVSPIAGDAVRLGRVVTHLVRNAIQFTPSGGRIEVALSTHRERAVVRVSDNGRGIEPVLLPHVFNRFGQGGGRLGLGLLYSRRILELHGGTVSAASDGEGRGASFTMTLPFGGATAASGGDHVLRGRTILLVEDEADLRELLCDTLTHHGARVCEAATAHDALAALDGIQADVLVSDIGLPDCDGIDFIRRLRSRGADGNGTIPAVALTGYAREEDKTRVLDAGYQMHVSKPIDLGQLVNVIVKLLATTR